MYLSTKLHNFTSLRTVTFMSASNLAFITLFSTRLNLYNIANNILLLESHKRFLILNYIFVCYDKEACYEAFVHHQDERPLRYAK